MTGPIGLLIELVQWVVDELGCRNNITWLVHGLGVYGCEEVNVSVCIMPFRFLQGSQCFAQGNLKGKIRPRCGNIIVIIK